MRLHDHDGQLSARRPRNKPIALEVWDRLERIRYSVGMNHDAFANHLRMSKRDYIRFRNTRTTPSITACADLLESLDLSLEFLYQGKIDFNALAARYAGAKSAIPSHYLVGANSRIRTLVVLVTYVEENYGWRAAASLLRKFQLNHSALANPDEKVNIRLMTDAMNRLSQQGMSAECLYDMGARSSGFSVHHSLAVKLADQKNPSQLYERIVSDFNSHFDNNCRYSLRHLSEDRCLIMAEQNEEVIEALRQPLLGSRNTCTYRGGVLASFPGFKGLPAAHAKELACVHRGDPACLYEIGFDEPLKHMRLQAAV